MLFGQSVFQSVLDRLDDEGADDTGETVAHHIRGLNVSFAATVLEGVSAASSRPDDAYLENLGEEPTPPEAVEAAEPPPPVMPEHLLRIAPADVAGELAITATDTAQSLGEKRRAFAKANHPDSVAPAFRDNATARMTIANLLIDEALRRLSR